MLLKSSPDYVQKLQSLKYKDYLRLFMGSWNSYGEITLFNPEMIKVIDDIPPDWKITGRVRSWDLAATEVSDDPNAPKSYADYTAGVKISRTTTGMYIVEHAKRFRKNTAGVIQEIIGTAHDDDVNMCKVTVPRDSGAGGIAFNQYLVRTLAEAGIPATSVKMSGHSSKLSRFQCFLALVDAGCVYMIRGDWNKAYLDELTSFDPERRSSIIKDDLVDATSDAANYLAKQIQLPVFTLPSLERDNPVASIFG